MNRPTIVCHMMTSVDGRIDCAMTAKLRGVDDYYATLEALEAPTTLSGRVTAELELALPGRYAPKDPTPIGHEAFAKNRDAAAYEVVVDTKGTLLWPDDADAEKPHLILTTAQAPKEYLDYLTARSVSWVVCGEKRIDLPRAMETLAAEFGVKRLAAVGGPTINTAFLAAGLLDEISLLIGLGVDGRAGFPPVFDGLPQDAEPIPLTLKSAQALPSGAVWLRCLPAK
ncbi:MAG TPA: dihydrofolate reductase family protein [Candidatus Spyradenecus faecavium]|uniref:Dihydrofolate reductase family protein n=1 Tax=Candidatus Spyradenecus faecavium TaxID=2840947 RepID=A0A9D1NMT7_9BACT|nr:dihydrofolate reductase family protein [Candidatus Spyradenecus faecavium]